MSLGEDMKYVDSGDHIQPNDKTEYFFNRSGRNLESSKEKVFGKVVAKNGNSYYYIRVHQSVPYDPMGTYAKREEYLQTKMEQVSKTTFDFYMLYLQTKNSIYMTKARRGLTKD